MLIRVQPGLPRETRSLFLWGRPGSMSAFVRVFLRLNFKTFYCKLCSAVIFYANFSGEDPKITMRYTVDKDY